MGRGEEAKWRIVRISDDVADKLQEMTGDLGFPPGTPPNQVIRKVLGLPLRIRPVVHRGSDLRPRKRRSTSR